MTGPTVVPCLTCHRPLWDEVSRRVQRGPVCRERAGIVVVVLPGPRPTHRAGPAHPEADPDQLPLWEAS